MDHPEIGDALHTNTKIRIGIIMFEVIERIVWMFTGMIFLTLAIFTVYAIKHGNKKEEEI